MFNKMPTAVEVGADRPIIVRLALGWIQNFYPCYLQHIDKEPCRVCMQEEDAR